MVSEVTVLGLADGGVYEDAKCAGAAGLPMVTRGMVRWRQSATALYLIVIILLPGRTSFISKYRGGCNGNVICTCRYKPLSDIKLETV